MTMFEEIRDLTIKLVSIPSVNSTSGECHIADAIEAYFRQIPYFKAHPDQVFTQPLEGDALNRRNVFALLKGEKGSSKNTIICHGHIDTVDVDDYSALKPYAFDCRTLAEKLKNAPISDEVRADLESGDYLFGRGACDMKCGDAVFMVLAKHLSEHPEKLDGNLLFSFNPVEENLHWGMTEAIKVFNRLKEAEGLHYVLALNNDYICPMYPGDTTRYVYTGAVGKLLPTFYIVGRETHVGQCFEGFPADLTAAELIREIDLNPDFCDGYKGEFTLPPSVLKMQDLKATYNVQTPHKAMVYFNYFVHNKQLTEIMEKLKTAAANALERVRRLQDERYRQYCELSSIQYTKLHEEFQVMEYAEALDKAQAVYDGDLTAHLEALTDRLILKDIDKRDISVALADEICRIAGIKTPTIVIFFSTPYCPHNTLKAEVPEEAAVISRLSGIAAEFAQESGENMKLLQFFPSLSDSSYIKIDDDDASVDMLYENFPGIRRLYDIPLREGKQLNIPAVNYGCWGKDCHKWTERVYMPYSFGKLPQFILKTIENYFMN